MRQKEGILTGGPGIVLLQTNLEFVHIIYYNKCQIMLSFIPAGNEPGDCLQNFGGCREGQMPRLVAFRN